MLDFTVPTERYEYDVRALSNEFFPGSAAYGDTLEITEDENSFTIKLGKTEKKYTIDETDFSLRKKFLKRSLYQFLNEYTGESLPWGALTGIRPTKLVRLLMDEGRAVDEISRIFKEQYFVSDEKTVLSTEIARTEKRIIDDCLSDNPDKTPYGIYIGIPFCPTRCLYCSFTSYPADKYKKQTDAYVDALIKEIREVSKSLASKRPNCIYMGGGTPTTLSDLQMKRVLDTLRECFDLSGLKEGCVECGRPDSITAEKLKVIKESGFIDRISVNPQTMNQKTLDVIGRRHTVEDIKRAFALARDTGFDNINMDIIAGLPGEGAAEMEHTLSEIEKLSPDNLTVHTLAVKRAAALNLNMESYEATLGKDIKEQLLLASQSTGRMGMKPYYLYRQKNMVGNFENTGYSRPGKEGIYNILIMEEVEPIFAFGAGAVTKMVYPDGRIERTEDPKDVGLYLERLNALIENKIQLINA